MAGLPIHKPRALTVGILGNVISFLVFLAPVSTFYHIYKKKSTEGFQSEPYVVALFSAMLWLYYAFIKTDEMILLIINSIGVIIESFYIAIYMAYAHNKARIYTAKIFLSLNMGVFSTVVLFTLLLVKGESRVTVIGWICVVFAISVFAAPLSIMKMVIKTRSVEFMPFYLSFFLILSAIAWFLYGLFIEDKYVMLPNVLGFLFGLAQIILYMIFKKPMEGKVKNACQHIKPVVEEDEEEQGKASQGKNKAENNMKNDIISQA